jgi:poly(A) polymerase
MTKMPLLDSMTAPQTRAVFAALEGAGGPACVRFVGGCVRNALMGREISDLDLATQLTPGETEAALAAAGLRSVPTGKAFGTITAVVDGQPYEITSLREDVETDGRRAVVRYTTDWAKDAQRRDFYLNALYADIDGRVYDPTGEGLADIAARRVRFIGEAEQRIREDYLRILRFFRFTASYAREIDAASLAACLALKDGIDGLSGERIQQEVLKTLAVANPLRAFEAMLDGGVLSHVLPGWRGADLRAFKAMLAISAEPERRLIALLDDGGLLEDAALKTLRDRLRLSQRLYLRLKSAHEAAEALAEGEEIRRLIYAHGREAALDAVALSGAHLGKAPARAQNLLDSLRDLAVPVFPLKGADLIAHGLAAGPQVGQTLKAIEADWLRHDFSQGVIDAALDRLGKTPK